MSYSIQGLVNIHISQICETLVFYNVGMWHWSSYFNFDEPSCGSMAPFEGGMHFVFWNLVVDRVFVLSRGKTISCNVFRFIYCLYVGIIMYYCKIININVGSVLWISLINTPRSKKIMKLIFNINESKSL